MRRYMPRGIRLRLVLAISAVSIGALAASFFALHETTAANLRTEAGKPPLVFEEGVFSVRDHRGRVVPHDEPAVSRR